MKKLNLFALISIIFIFFSSCSNDNENNNSENRFTFNGTSYIISNVYLNDENTTDNNPSDIAIIMSNINLLTDSQPSGVNYLYFDFQGIEPAIGSITNIQDYNIIENASYENSEIGNGTTILDDSEIGYTATNTSVNINSISSNQIDFDFSFTREDGEIINGNYSGSYINISQ